MVKSSRATKRIVAYFSMEIALQNAMPSYSGGLGVLAGDTVRAAADIKLPMVAISLLYRSGYFTQRLAEDGSQTEDPVAWRVEDFLKEEPARVTVPLENRRVELRAWRYDVKGVHGFVVPVYFLDAALESNAEQDRALTGSLYGGDSYYRLCQEVLLGVGGVRMLRALGHTDLTRYHMNEGHAAMLTLELLGEEAEKAGRTSTRGEDIEKVRSKCIFTTHTPVPAGHDRFPMEYLTRAFPDQNGLFDRYISSWREDNYSLRSALGMPPEELWASHLIAKHDLFEAVRTKTGLTLDPDVFTIGFARRATGYKRADLILSDLDRLRQIAKNAGKFQIVYAGKAHPHDAGGKDIIRHIFSAKKALKKAVTIVFLDEYNMEVGGKITAGVDLWLNTPQFPLEASGTSGMKAALNGVPSLSILDGWWVEGHIEGVTGWSIGESRLSAGPQTSVDNNADVQSLYQKLENVILPLFYKDRTKYLSVMQHSIAINGSFFNTQRMVQQYVTDAYLR